MTLELAGDALAGGAALDTSVKADPSVVRGLWEGSFVFYGIVLVQGALKTAGGGSTDAHFYGAVMAASVDLTLNTLAGNATLQYSKCAITNAMEGTQSVSPIRSRGWIQLF